MKIDKLKELLDRVQKGQTEFDFAGITSNGIDCIYFMRRADHTFDIDFEAMVSDQIPYLKKLEDFAKANNLHSTLTSYGNQPKYSSDKPAPVLHMDLGKSAEDAARVGERIQREVFKNGTDMTYEIVP
jgi:hypothetical protein